MAEHPRSARRWLVAFTTAASLLLSGSGLVFAGPGDVNSINDGKTIQGGTYLNTADGRTTFINSAGTGIHLESGSTLVGREVNGAGAWTGNGGNVLINAPNQAVRLDGNIDVRGANQGGFIVGSGGNVTINSAFLYQSGQIMANGVTGGMVTANVGGMTMGPNAVINATGTTGAGGVVKINSPGAVDIQRGAIIDTSGKVMGSYDTNVINIKGGLVNLEGVLTANGLDGVAGSAGTKGGMISVKATGNTPAVNQLALDNAGTMFTAGEKSAIVNRDAAMRNGNTNPAQSSYVGQSIDGSIAVASSAKITANGGRGAEQVVGNPQGCGCGGGSTEATKAGDGGVINLDACKDIVQNGTIQANGGNAGGFLKGYPNNKLNIPESGKPFGQGLNGLNGGKGGNITFTYRGDFKPGAGSSVQAKGGNASNGQDAKVPGYIAYGGKGGDGGNGGTVNFRGPNLTQAARDTVNVDGGAAGKPGNLNACSSCQVPGLPGAPGDKGKITHGPAPACPTCDAPPPPTTPPSTPNTPNDGRTLYPKEYPRLGEALPGSVGPLVNYNRSVFMARSPLPIVKKRTPVLFPARSVPPPPVVRKAKPPQKKAPVRGYW